MGILFCVLREKNIGISYLNRVILLISFIFILLLSMKKLLVILLLPLFSLGQELNKTNDGYTEVVDIELT